MTLTYNSVTLTYLHEVEDGRIAIEYVRQHYLGTSECINLMLTVVLTALEVSKVPVDTDRTMKYAPKICKFAEKIVPK